MVRPTPPHFLGVRDIFRRGPLAPLFTALFIITSDYFLGSLLIRIIITRFRILVHGALRRIDNLLIWP